MKSIFVCIAVATAILFSGGAAFGATPQQVLEHVDNVRAPGPDFIFTVKASLLNKEKPSADMFEVRVRENTKSLVLQREPVKQRGRVLLMDGPDMWIYIPGTSRALRISPQQQLVGGASNADIARVVFSLDYTPDSYEWTTDADGNNLLKLSLSSRASNTPYRYISLYCTESYEPVKAEFFSLSKKLLRTAFYEDYQTVLGKRRPMTVRMISAVNANDNVLLIYSAMDVKDTPQNYYQPSYLNQIR